MPRARQCLAATLFGILTVAGACCPDGFLCFDDGGAPCGGDLEIVCPQGQFCQFTDGSCGTGGQLGLCAPRPEVCPEIFAPVCGCDGQTYENECQAAGAGVSVAFAGACDTSGDECGGLAGTSCNEGQYCRFVIGSCGADDQTGNCEPFPDVCPELFSPVCGCDGLSYGNSCEAAAAGVSIAGLGECE